MSERFGMVTATAAAAVLNARPLLLRVYVVHRIHADFGAGISRRSVSQVARDLSAKPHNISIAERELEALGLISRRILHHGAREVAFREATYPQGSTLPAVLCKEHRDGTAVQGAPTQDSTPSPVGSITPSPVGSITPSPVGTPDQRKKLRVIQDARAPARARTCARASRPAQPAPAEHTDAAFAEASAVYNSQVKQLREYPDSPLKRELLKQSLRAISEASRVPQDAPDREQRIAALIPAITIEIDPDALMASAAEASQAEAQAYSTDQAAQRERSRELIAGLKNKLGGNS